MLLATTVGRGDAHTKDASIRQAIADVEGEIANLREIIADLRSSLLNDLGLAPALEALGDRRRQENLRIDSELRLPSDSERLLAPELQTVYRLVQEALTNVSKHLE